MGEVVLSCRMRGKEDDVLDRVVKRFRYVLNKC